MTAEGNAKRYLVLGAGMMGSAVAYDLANAVSRPYGHPCRCQ